MQQHLTNILEITFKPEFLEVVDESHNHSGDRENSHFKIIVVSDDFAGVSLINRHRQINELFREELTHIHALAMFTYTPDEWSKKTTKPNSPDCLGGGK
jgi:BolA protein